MPRGEGGREGVRHRVLPWEWMGATEGGREGIERIVQTAVTGRDGCNGVSEYGMV